MNATTPLAQSPNGGFIHERVAEGIRRINKIILLLNSKVNAPGAVDLIECTYTDEENRSFSSLTKNANRAFSAASESAAVWFGTLSTKTSEKDVERLKLQGKIDAVTREVDKKGLEIASLTEEEKSLTERITSVKAQLNHSREQSRNIVQGCQNKRRTRNWFCALSCLCCGLGFLLPPLWFCAAGNCAVATGFCCAHRRAAEAVKTSQQDKQFLEESLKSTTEQVQSLKSEKLVVEFKRNQFQADMDTLTAQRDDLESLRRRLMVVKQLVDQCKHTVDAAHCSAKVLSNQMSLQNFVSSVQGLVRALRADNEFSGLLDEQFDEQTFQQLGVAVARINARFTDKRRL